MRMSQLTSSKLRQRLKKGTSKLPNSELIAILLETTPPDQEMRTLDLTFQLLNYDDELRHFLGLIHEWLCYTQDIFEANEVSLKVSLEVQRRALTKVLKNRSVLLYPDLTHHFLMLELSELAPDVMFSGLFLNQQHRMMGFEDLFYGDYDNKNPCHQHTILTKIQQKAKRYKAPFVLMARNSLSSEAEQPTLADISLVRWLTKELHFTKVALLDCWIIYEDSSLSLEKEGFII
jgi:DNA repair protein RadC